MVSVDGSAIRLPGCRPPAPGKVPVSSLVSRVSCLTSRVSSRRCYVGVGVPVQRVLGHRDEAVGLALRPGARLTTRQAMQLVGTGIQCLFNDLAVDCAEPGPSGTTMLHRASAGSTHTDPQTPAVRHHASRGVAAQPDHPHRQDPTTPTNQPPQHPHPRPRDAASRPCDQTRSPRLPIAPQPAGAASTNVPQRQDPQPLNAQHRAAPRASRHLERYPSPAAALTMSNSFTNTC